MRVTPNRSGLITAASQIRALASPTRQDIVDILESSGPCTVAELARLLGRRPDSLYFHLRFLCAAGLVIERRATTNSVAPRGQRFDVRGRPIRILYRPGDRAKVRAVTRVVATMLRTADRNFRRAFLVAGSAPPPPRTSGNRRNVWGGRSTGWLNERELRRVNALIVELTMLLKRKPPTLTNRRLYEVTFVLVPASAPAPPFAR